MIKQFFLYLFILFLTLNSASALNNDDDVLIPKVYKKIHPDLPDRLPDLNSGYNIYGFVNKNGKWIIEGKVSNYDKSVVFRKGGEISAENFPDFNWGIIDRNGSWVIEPKYVYPLIIKEKLIAACAGVKECGYIDKKNKWVIKPQFDTALDFSEGIAIVKKMANGVLLIKKVPGC